MAAATSPTLFASAGPAPTPTDVADDHSLLTLDRELDFLLERIEDEIEESGEASKEAMERLQLFCQAMNVKVDRIGRYLAVMKTRAAHCKEEAARFATRARGALRSRPGRACRDSSFLSVTASDTQRYQAISWIVGLRRKERHRDSYRRESFFMGTRSWNPTDLVK